MVICAERVLRDWEPVSVVSPAPWITMRYKRMLKRASQSKRLKYNVQRNSEPAK